MKQGGHHVLFRSEHSVLFRSFKERNILLLSFFEFLATYDPQKNAKNATFFCKEHKITQRTQRTQRSFATNIKERENVLFFCKRTQNVLFFFQNIYIDIYRYTFIQLNFIDKKYDFYIYNDSPFYHYYRIYYKIPDTTTYLWGNPQGQVLNFL